MLNIVLDKENICILNVYAPASNDIKEKIANAKQFMQMIDGENKVEHIICGGDFNLHDQCTMWPFNILFILIL